MPIYQVKVNEIKTQAEANLYIEADTYHEAERAAISHEILQDLMFDEVYDYIASAEPLGVGELKEIGEIKIIKAKDVEIWN